MALYCLYYTARLERSRVWELSSMVRGSEHVAFDRCIDARESEFEFFVPALMHQTFLSIMAYAQSVGIVLSFEQKENRLQFEEVE